MAGKEYFMKKLFKKFAAIGMAAMMIMAMGVTAFAADAKYDGAYAAEVYDPGTYGTSDQDLSMGDPAVLDADVSYSDGVTTLKVYTTEMNGVMGIFSGYINTMSITAGSQTVDGAFVAATDTVESYFVFELPGDYSTGTQVFDTSFTIHINELGFNHPAVSGDLVCYF